VGGREALRKTLKIYIKKRRMNHDENNIKKGDNEQIDGAGSSA
jgi:Arc/MetJ family transcription regulator